IDMRRPFADEFLVLLRHAPEDADDLLRVSPLVVLERPEGAIDLVLRMLPDAAGVEEDHIRLLGIRGEFEPRAAQTPDDQLAIEHVHLAADGFDVEFFGHPSYSSSSNNRSSAGATAVSRFALT